jgi:hypothetical protein
MIVQDILLAMTMDDATEAVAAMVAVNANVHCQAIVAQNRTLKVKSCFM